MSVANSSSHSRESEQVRAQHLPADFGEDEPEVIELRTLQASAKAEREKAERALGSFGETQGARAQEMWKAQGEIENIDNARPRLLARLMLAGGDFTEDANQQRRRRELDLLVERYKLASPVFGALRKELELESAEAGNRHTKVSNQIRDVLHRLRMEHVAAQH